MIMRLYAHNKQPILGRAESAAYHLGFYKLHGYQSFLTFMNKGCAEG